MTVTEIAIAVVTLLSPFLSKAGEEISKKAGEAAWKKVQELHKVVKERFNKEEDMHAANTLARFEKKPEARKAGLQEVLEEILEKDPGFASSVRLLLEEADRANAGKVFNVEFNTNVSGYGRVGKVINIGGDVKGDLKG